MKNLSLSADNPNMKSRKGHDRALSILIAARDLIISEGFQSLTMRKIASKCSITVGNLSYYYPSKENLTHELVASILHGYEEDWVHIVENDNLSADQKLTDFAALLIEDLDTFETTRFFPELWVMAVHDPVVAEAMNDIYSKVETVYKDLISQVNPSLNKTAVETLALFMTATVEGHTVFIGNGKKGSVYAPHILKFAQSAFLNMAKSSTNDSILS